MLSDITLDCSIINFLWEKLSSPKSPFLCGSKLEYTKGELVQDLEGKRKQCPLCSEVTAGKRWCDTDTQVSASSSWSSLSSPPPQALWPLLTNSNPRPTTICFSAIHRGSSHKEPTTSYDYSTSSICDLTIATGCAKHQGFLGISDSFTDTRAS